MGVTRVLVLLVVWSFARGTESLFRRSCIGGHRHGYNVDFTRYWYYCNDGHLENRGCFAQNRKRLSKGESYVYDGFRLECGEVEGELKLLYTACVVEGKMHLPGEYWMGDQAEWYECVEEEMGIRMQLMGCVMGDGKSLYMGGETIENDIVYKCEESVYKPVQLLPVACIHNEHRYGVGEIFQDEQFWYSCTKDQFEKGEKQLMGCVHFDQRIREGDRYVLNEVVYQCQLRPLPLHKVHGCIRISPTFQFQHIPLRATWLQGERPFRYLIQCSEAEGGGAEKRPVGCVLTEDDSDFVIHPDCFMVNKKKAVGCKAEKDGSLKFKSFPATSLFHAFKLNVRYCVPSSL